MDDADHASLQAEQLEALRRLAVPKPETPANGYCFNCDAAVADRIKFCTPECHADHEYRERLAAR